MPNPLDILQLVSGAATVSTIGLFSTGIWTCYKIHTTKSVGVVPHLPFVACFTNCALWLNYGLLKGDSTISLVNLVGLVLQLAYIIVYHTYTETKATFRIYGVRRDTLIAFAVVLPVVAYFSLIASSLSSLDYLGIICNIVTIGFFASPLANMAEVIRSRSTDSMSLLLTLMSITTTASWTLYGFLIVDFYVKFPNTLGLLLSLVQLSLFLIYRGRSTIVSLETPRV